jgi:lysophospholipase L1-like esterase
MLRTPRTAAALKYLTLVLFGATCGLVAVEIGLRTAAPGLWKDNLTFATNEWLTYHPILGWMNKAGYATADFRINQLRLRGEEAAATKPPGTLRIVCLGDSRTFGVWLDRGRFRFNNDYPAALAQRLRQNPAGMPVEVLNAGVIGYNSGSGLRQLRMQLLALHPDIITVAFGLNDHLLAWSPALRAAEPRNPLLRELFYQVDDLHAFQLGLSLYQAASRFHPHALSVHWVEPDDYAYNLRRFAAVARRYGIHLLFVTQALRPLEMGDSQPAFPGFVGKPDSLYLSFGARDLAEVHRVDDEYTGILRRVAQEESVPVADAAAAFTAHQGAPLFGPYDFVHCNPAGARVVARTIYDKLLELGWLPPAGLPAAR